MGTIVEHDTEFTVKCPQSLLDEFKQLFPWRGALSMMARWGLEEQIRRRKSSAQPQPEVKESSHGDGNNREGANAPTGGQVQSEPSLNDRRRRSGVRKTPPKGKDRGVKTSPKLKRKRKDSSEEDGQPASQD